MSKYNFLIGCVIVDVSVNEWDELESIIVKDNYERTFEVIGICSDPDDEPKLTVIGE